MTQSYQMMTASGVWAGSYQVGTPAPDGLIPAPADAAGFHGAEGLRWDGAGWVVDTLSAWRAACWVDRWQIIAALDLIDPAHWPKIEAHAASPGCDPVTRSAIRNVARIPRQSEIVDFFAWLLDMEPPQVDDLFRLAERIRG